MLADLAHEIARTYAESGSVPPEGGLPSEEEQRARFSDWADSFSEAFLVLKQAFNQATGREDIQIGAQMIRRTFTGGRSLAGIRYQLAGRQWLIETFYPEVRVYRLANLSAHPGTPALCFTPVASAGGRMGIGNLAIGPDVAAAAVFSTMAG